MSCKPEYDLCVIRGDSFALDVGLNDAFVEVQEDPFGWEGRLVFREDQDDDIVPYLELTAVPEVNPSPLPDEVATYLQFRATPQQTQSLPDWSHVYFVELVYVGPTAPDSGTVSRLFQGNAEVSD